MKRLRAMCSLFVAGFLMATSPVLGDIPPPPPSVPGTEMPLPEALPVVILGGLLSLGITVVGLWLVKKKPSRSKRIWVIIPATVVALITVGVAIWAAIEHAGYADQRRDWRPLGPVRRFEPPSGPTTRRIPPSNVAPASPAADPPK